MMTATTLRVVDGDRNSPNQVAAPQRVVGTKAAHHHVSASLTRARRVRCAEGIYGSTPARSS
jgi:hypothetical protein